jgi:protein-tyrosine phosphatase
MVWHYADKWSAHQGRGMTCDTICRYDRRMDRIDVHAHLLPGIDDGCPSLQESLECARLLVAAGYSHCFCTPHVWAGCRNVARDTVTQAVADLQQALRDASIPLQLLPGSELNLHPTVTQTTPDKVIAMALADKYILVDMWADKMPDWFPPTIRWLQDRKLTVILAHPERMRAVQDHPELVRQFIDMGLLLQGNLQCFADRPDSYTRRTAELLLEQGHYFALGSDLHNIVGLKTRLTGLSNAITFAGDQAIHQRTCTNPRLLLS